MKRDLDLIRRLLLDIESAGEQPNAPASWNRSGDNGVDTEVIHYHVQLLHDAGLIVADELVPGQWWPERITWAGHEFLDLARDDATWRQVRTDIEAAAGSAPFEIVRSHLARVVGEKLSPARTRRK